MQAELDAEQCRAMFLQLATAIIAAKDQLTQADQAIGDGDHGIGMARGFEAVFEALEQQQSNSIGDVLLTVGTQLMRTTGGAAGAIFGTFFRGAAKSLEGRSRLDTATAALMLAAGRDAVQQRGGAKAGDKTMLDALIPATQSLSSMTSAPLDEALTVAAEAARLGMEQTKQMVAATGKAKSLGERSLGHPDPGALSTCLMLRAMAEFVNDSAE